MIDEVHSSGLRESVLEAAREVHSAGVFVPWHYRDLAEWWPDFDRGDADAEALRQFVRCAGEPALEVGCGSGNRLLYCRRAGLRVDGSEETRGLYALCRERSESLGASALRLYAQAFHELDLPRRYASIYAGGVLGTGLSPDADSVGLRRLYRLLEVGGVLMLDQPAPWGDESRFALWWRRFLASAPPLPAHELRAARGDEALHLWCRPYACTPGSSSVTYTARGQHSRSGQPVSARSVALRQRFYTRAEVARLLVQAGFEPSSIRSTYARDRRVWTWTAEKWSPARPQTVLGPLGPILQAGAIGLRLGS